MKTKLGLSLIELIIFIVILGLLANIIVTTYLNLFRGTANLNPQTEASKAATKCMEWYLGQRFINGFNSPHLVCGSSTPSFCSTGLIAGLSINATVNCTPLYNDPTNYKTITVTVSGQGSAILSTIIADY